MPAGVVFIPESNLRMASEMVSSTIIRPEVGSLFRLCVSFAYLIWWFFKSRVLRFASVAISGTLVIGLLLVLFDVAMHTLFLQIGSYLQRASTLYRDLADVFRIVWGVSIIGAAYHEWHRFRKLKQEVFLLIQ